MKKILHVVFILIITMLFLVGCKNYEFDTLSGKPEVIIVGVPKDKIVDGLNNIMIGEGYQIMDLNKYQITYNKTANSLGASVLYGSDYNSNPDVRVIFNFVEYEDKIRIIASIKIVTNPNSAFEKITDRTYSVDGEKYYEILKEFQSDLMDFNE